MWASTHFLFFRILDLQGDHNGSHIDIREMIITAFSLWGRGVVPFVEFYRTDGFILVWTSTHFLFVFWQV